MVHRRNDIFHWSFGSSTRSTLTEDFARRVAQHRAQRQYIDLRNMVDGQGILAGVSMDGSVKFKLQLVMGM